MSDEKPTHQDEVEKKAKDIFVTLVCNWVWARLKTSVVPVIAALLATQGGAALFVPDHVKVAVASEVNPAKTKAETLEKGTTEAYHALALVVNSQGKILHGKAAQAEVDRLYDTVDALQNELDDHVIMLEALQRFVRKRLGNSAFQRELDEVEVEPAAAGEAVATRTKVRTQQHVPVVPVDFREFLKGKEEKDAGDPHARED